MAMPNLDNINDFSQRLNVEAGKLKGNNWTRDMLVEISDTLISMQKEIRWALQNLDYGNMPSVQVDVDGVKTKLTDATGDIATIKESGHELSRMIESNKVLINGEVKRLNDVIDEKTGNLLKGLDAIKKEMSTIKQTADEVSIKVESTKKEFDKKVEDVEKALDKTVNDHVKVIENSIAELKVKDDSISSTIANIKNEFDGKVSTISSSVQEVKETANSYSRVIKETKTTLDGKINDVNSRLNGKVDSSDFNGRQLISMINMDSSSATIRSSKITLESYSNILRSPDGRVELRLEDSQGGGYGDPTMRLRMRQNSYDRFDDVLRVDYPVQQPSITIGNRNKYNSSTRNNAITRVNMQGVIVDGWYNYHASTDVSDL